MIKMFQDDLIKVFLNLLNDNEIIEIFEYDDRFAAANERLPRFKETAKLLEGKTSNYIIKKSLKIIIGSKKENVTRKKTYETIKRLIE